MTIEVTLISTETIKPSSPTPQHLKTHKFSFLDQLHPKIYSHVVLFYEVRENSTNSDLNIIDVLHKLKKSLSKALTLFYPLAGRIADDYLSIDCNDEGVYFSETRVNCRMVDFLRNPDLNLLNNFYPCHPHNCEPFSNIHPVMVQVNVFNDFYGLAIGLNFSHKVGDGISCRAFLKGWASCARGDSVDNAIPSFTAASIFTPCKDLPTESMATLGQSLVKFGTPTTRRFHFDASSIKTLKSKAETDSRVHFFSRVEVATAFIWKHAMAASEASTGSRKTSILSHAVDLRRRMVPPLDEFSIGNLLWIPSTVCTVSEDREVSSLVRKLRETITKIDGELVKKLVKGEGLEVLCDNVKVMGEVCSKGEVDYYGFTTWSKFGLYETDFGWGRPVWVSSHKIGGPVFTNLAHMLETRDGDGLDVWVTLDEMEMGMLLGDEEFLTLVTVDPSPIA